MGGCRCSYKNCKSATKTTENLHFFHYPVKHTERCRKWIQNACKPNFYDLAEDQLRNKVVCELHFEERCFTNISRKRLLHDAIPTLDAGAEETKPHRMEFISTQSNNDSDIQVLPASDDGTIFTLDADSLQQAPAPDKVESYIYQDGVLVPVYKNQSSNPTYSIQETTFDGGVGKNRDSEVTFESETKHDINQAKPYRLLFGSLAGNEEVPEEVSYEEEESNGAPESPVETKENIEMEVDMLMRKERKRAGVDKKVVRRVKQHSKDIAFIKKALKSTLVSVPGKNKKTALSILSSYLPPSLFTLVKMTAEKGDWNVAEDELEVFKQLFAASPIMYNSLKNKYGWNLPEF